MFSLLRTIILILLCSYLLLACAHSSKHHERSVEKATQTSKPISQGQQIADLAQSLLGSPYKYGGTTPNGFDCSGLVHYTHRKFGIHTPRTSLQQFKHARSIRLSELDSGDVVFFKLSRNNVSHVGIYVGNGRFVHAPKSGKRVAINHLNDDYWRPRIVSGGRFY